MATLNQTRIEDIKTFLETATKIAARFSNDSTINRFDLHVLTTAATQARQATMLLDQICGSIQGD